jgi:hypothetical protein
MAGRRGRRGSGSTEQSSTEGAPTSESGRPAALPQEVGAHIPVADEALKPAGIPEPLAVGAPDQHEHEPPLATELLETVSATAIQLHPTGPAEPMSAPGESRPSDDPGDAEVSQEAASVPHAALADSTPAYAEVALAADEQAVGAQSTADSADPVANETLAENRNPVSTKSAVTSDASSQDKVSVGASSQRGRATSQAQALAGPLELARTAIEANVTVWSYLRQEGDAARAHLRALSGVKSPAELMDLQASEMARALATALNLGQDLAKSAGLIANEPSSASKEK